MSDKRKQKARLAQLERERLDMHEEASTPKVEAKP